MEYYKQFSEDEAFAHAKRFYEESAVGGLPRHIESRSYVAGVEEKIFRPAMELQVAGLCLLAGKARNEIHIPASFAFFVVDHLAMGWVAMLVSQFRVAYTLSRATVEASIFETASVANPSEFEQLWGTERGTGGAVLQTLSSVIPERQRNMFDLAWKFTRAFGHPSFAPVLSSAQLVKDFGGQKVSIMTFGGPYIEPLNLEALNHLSFVYGLGAMAGLEAMQLSLSTHFDQSSYWKDKYEAFELDTKELADKAASKLNMS